MIRTAFRMLPAQVSREGFPQLAVHSLQPLALEFFAALQAGTRFPCRCKMLAEELVAPLQGLGN